MQIYRYHRNHTSISLISILILQRSPRYISLSSLRITRTSRRRRAKRRASYEGYAFTSRRIDAIDTPWHTLSRRKTHLSQCIARARWTSAPKALSKVSHISFAITVLPLGTYARSLAMYVSAFPFRRVTTRDVTIPPYVSYFRAALNEPCRPASVRPTSLPSKQVEQTSSVVFHEGLRRDGCLRYTSANISEETYVA